MSLKMQSKILLGNLYYLLIFLSQFSDGQNIQTYSFEYNNTKFKRSLDNSISSIKEKYFMKSSTLNSNMIDILTSNKFRYILCKLYMWVLSVNKKLSSFYDIFWFAYCRTKVECAGLCLATDHCYAFKWEESSLKCTLLKQDGLCFNDDPAQSTSVYVDEFDPLPVYMECDRSGKGLNLYWIIMIFAKMINMD